MIFAITLVLKIWLILISVENTKEPPVNEID